MRWIMFVRENEGFLCGACGHRAFGQVLFELTSVNVVCSVFNTILNNAIYPFFWICVSLDGLVTHVTQLHRDGGGLVFVDHEIAGAAKIRGHYIIS